MGNIRYSHHPVMFRNSPIGFIISLALIFSFGVGILILLAWYLSCRGSYLKIEDGDMLFEKGILSKNRIEISISKIRSVRVNQSFFQRMFDVGTVEVYTAGDNPELTINGIPHPNEVRTLVKEIQNKDEQ